MKKGIKVLTVLCMLVGSMIPFFHGVSALDVPNRTLTNNLQDDIVAKQYQEISDISASVKYLYADMDLSTSGLEFLQFKSSDESQIIKKYSYIEYDHIQFTFLDGQSHSGILTYTVTGTGRSFISDNPNVQVYNNKIYFYNCSSVDVYTTNYYLYQNTVSVHSTYFNVTLSSLTYSEFHDVNDMYTLFTENGGIIADLDEIRISTQATATRLQSALNKLDNITNVLSGISSTLGLTYNEVVEQGLTLDQMLTSLSSIEEYITTFHSFDIPEESFNLNWSFFKRNIGILSISNNLYWSKYPIFDMKTGNSVNFTINANSDRYLILGLNVNASNSSNFLNYFSMSEGVSITSYNNLKSSLPQFRFVRLVLRNSTGSNINNSLTALADINVIPIYYGDGTYLSTSFMERWIDSTVDSTVVDDSANILDDQIQEFEDFETDIIDDFDENIELISFDSPFETNPEFSSSSSWMMDLATMVISVGFLPYFIVIMILWVCYRIWG